MKKVVLIALIFICFFSCLNPKANENKKNLQKVKSGMHLKEVIYIMGLPDTIISEPLHSNRIWYVYKSSSLMADNFYIYISKNDSLVEGINDGN